MSRLIFNVAAKCDKAGRQENQDNYWVCPDLNKWNAPLGTTVGHDEDQTLSDMGALLVVADGMGGMNAGEKASELVIATIKKAFSNIPDGIIGDEESVKTFVFRSIVQSDLAVKDYAKSHPQAEGLGSTIVLLWLLGGKAYCGWCGDSRIYRYNPNNELVRLSHDHSFVQGLVDDGKISEEEAFDHPDGNIVTRSLGDNGDQAQPEVVVYDICERDVFLLCSDGLCGLLQDKEIEEIISKNCSSTKDALSDLWKAGTEAGWSDNATIELLCVVEGGIRPKGVAVGYPKKKIVPRQPKTGGKNHPKSGSSSNDGGSKGGIFSAPYMYLIVFCALLAVGASLWFTLSNSGNDKAKDAVEIEETDTPNIQGNSGGNKSNFFGNQGGQRRDNNGSGYGNDRRSGGNDNNRPGKNNDGKPNDNDNRSSVEDGNKNQEHPANGQQPSHEFIQAYDKLASNFNKVSNAVKETRANKVLTSDDKKLLSNYKSLWDNSKGILNSEKNKTQQHKEHINSFNQLYGDVVDVLSKYTHARPQPRQAPSKETPGNENHGDGNPGNNHGLDIAV